MLIFIWPLCHSLGNAIHFHESDKARGVRRCAKLEVMHTSHMLPGKCWALVCKMRTNSLCSSPQKWQFSVSHVYLYDMTMYWVYRKSCKICCYATELLSLFWMKSWTGELIRICSIESHLHFISQTLHCRQWGRPWGSSRRQHSSSGCSPWTWSSTPPPPWTWAQPRTMRA